MVGRRYPGPIWLLVCILFTSIAGCGGSGSDVGGGSSTYLGTWVSGADTDSATGVYGTKNTADPANVPGARNLANSWYDGTNLWLFGGSGYDSAGTLDFLNDLWKWDGTNWTWISGANTVSATGVYGTQNTADSNNMPGARAAGISWRDGTGNLWLFGGVGYDSAASQDDLNDLWKWDGTNWTWVSGADTVGASGVYGTQDTPDAANVPGARDSAVSWYDGSNLWLFGGAGYDSAGMRGDLNDLWKWDGTNWTWISGADTKKASGVYGTKNTADPANVPGARDSAVSWYDGSNLWLFGGFGRDSAGSLGDLNDLWKWNGTNWTWVSGADTVGATGVYGTQGTAAATNVPGARYSAVSWYDGSNLWLFGGGVHKSPSGTDYLNDLWKWDGTNWTWVSGANTINANGVYGTQGTAAAAYMPGARDSAVSWYDGSNLWLFGGFGFGSAGSYGYMNDLWKMHR
jgi:N-acetylneuraminic acid mutarotase